MELKRTAEDMLVSVDCHYLRQGKLKKQRARKRNAKASRKRISNPNNFQDFNKNESSGVDSLGNHSFDHIGKRRTCINQDVKQVPLGTVQSHISNKSFTCPYKCGNSYSKACSLKNHI